MKPILLSVIGGIIGFAVGLYGGFLIGAILAQLLEISDFEGESGYFALAVAFICCPIGIALGVYAPIHFRKKRLAKNGADV